LLVLSRLYDLFGEEEEERRVRRPDAKVRLSKKSRDGMAIYCSSRHVIRLKTTLKKNNDRGNMRRRCIWAGR